MKKGIIQLIIFVFIFFISTDVQALDITYKENKLIKSNGAILEDVDTVYPGDSISDSISIKNLSSSPKEIFFKVEGLDNNSTLEKLNLNMTLTHNNISSEIYNGPYSVATLSNYMSLGTYKSGYDGILKIKIEIPSSIDNNDSLKSIGTKWTFYTKEDNKYNTIAEVNVANPNTNDSINSYLLLAAISLIFICLIILFSINNQKDVITSEK